MDASNSTQAGNATIPSYYYPPYGIYGFEPNEGLAGASLGIFTILGGILLYQIIKHKTWYLMPLPVGCAMEIFSFAFRLQAAVDADYNSLVRYICYLFPLILTPTVVAMADYALVSKM